MVPVDCGAMMHSKSSRLIVKRWMYVVGSSLTGDGDTDYLMIVMLLKIVLRG